MKLFPVAVLLVPFAIPLGVVSAVATAASTTTTDDPAARCAAITALASPDLLIDSPRMEAAAKQRPMLGSGNDLETPAHCVVRGKIAPRTGAGGKPFGIKFELRLPVDWSGRFLFQGGGGLNGFVAAATGHSPPFGNTSPSALQRGFAVVSMDSGHEGGPMDASFAIDQQAKLDYGYVAIGKVTTTAKAIINRFYGRAPDKSYFAGCSNGGREAMMSVQRYPTEFDGAVAGDPAFNATAAITLATHGYRTLAAVAPRDDTGKPVLARALSAAEWSLLSKSILDACDDQDGLRDGMIFNHAACHFDPVALQCGKSRAAGCLSAAKVDALRRVFRGPRAADGSAFVSSWPFDGGVGAPDWQSWRTGYAGADGSINDRQVKLITDARDQYFRYPPRPLPDTGKLDYQQLLAEMSAVGAYSDAHSTELGGFAQRGGKLLLVTGWSDGIFSANDLIRWYEQLDADSRAATKMPAADYARLFLIPGMNHCVGGPSLDDVDTLSALVDWVEKGTAPAAMTARGKAFPGQSRPICAYPASAHYNGDGPTSAATSFSCRIN
jgi:feruloyl esterase